MGMRVALRVVSALSVAAIVSMGPTPDLIGVSRGQFPVTQRAEALASRETLVENGGEASRGADGSAQEAYDDRAFPETDIAFAQTSATFIAFLSIARLPGGKKANWQSIGPAIPFVPSIATTNSGSATVNSGRVTALAVSPSCHARDCALFVGAAGGGIWKADNALEQQPNWHPSGSGIPSNAIGSIIFDPTDPQGRTLYVGTGEPNGSADSETGVGLFKSTDSGRSWSLVPGSVAVAMSRSIGAVAVDPTNPNHIFLGTAVGRHGSSSVNGGRFTPPDARTRPVGLYESVDGGVSFTLAFSQPSDAVVTTSPTGGDFFRGGVTKIAFDRTGLTSAQPSRVYIALFDYGVYRSKGGGGFEQVFVSAGLLGERQGGGLIDNSSASRTVFALAPHGNLLRIYVGDAGSGQLGKPPNPDNLAQLYRVDNANVPASSLTTGTTNPGWTKLSSPTPGTPGFGPFNFCGGQCWYDLVVESPPGQADTVWIGGQMHYGEIGHQSNGRTVQRSTDAGVHFTDMTNDTQSPPLGMHPDQHAIAFDPENPGIAFLGSDGGVVRTSGEFVDASGDCAGRGLMGADLVDCHMWLSSIPTLITSLNRGLATLQFQSVSVNPRNPLDDIMGGTQDNGTWAFNGRGAGSWFESIGGDGGQSGVDATNSNIRFHTFFGPQPDVNFRGTDPPSWDWIGDPLVNSHEMASFYVPIIADPNVGGTFFVGLEHVWRTQDNGGSRAVLDLHCNEFTGDFPANVTCGDWVPIGLNLVSGSSSDKGTGYVVALRRASSDARTLWVGTRRGRVWISRNAGALPANVTFTRLDTGAQPRRFVSGIAVDPANANHAWLSFSGYNAYTPTTPGHVFEVMYNPASGTVTWKDISYNIGDQPITGIARDDKTRDLFVSTDFGVALLENGATTWVPAAGSFPPVAVYGLTIDSGARVLYAATHGRSVWKLDLTKQ